MQPKRKPIDQQAAVQPEARAATPAGSEQIQTRTPDAANPVHRMHVDLDQRLNGAASGQRLSIGGRAACIAAAGLMLPVAAVALAARGIFGGIALTLPRRPATKPDDRLPRRLAEVSHGLESAALTAAGALVAAARGRPLPD